MDQKTKLLNKVKNRFLFVPPSVENGLEPEAKIDDFKITQELGEGSFGRVLKVTHQATGKVYAIKAIDKRNKTNQEGKPYFRREIEIMYKVHHPNTVRLYTHFEDDVYCYFVMELVSKGNLYELMQKRKSTLDKASIVKYMRELISSVYYLHNMDPPIIHRDIKPENILIAEDNSVKLADFGWSNYIEDEGDVRSTYCGTPLYLAPEMIKEIGHDEFLDVWCLGVLLFELITGNLPFTGKNVENLSGNILKNKIIWPNDIMPEEKDLLSKILKTNPTDRLSLKGILTHPYFSKLKPHDKFFFLTPKEYQSEEQDAIFLISTGDINPQKKTSKKAVEKKAESGKAISGFSAKDQSGDEPRSSNNSDVEILKKDLSAVRQKLEKAEKEQREMEKSNTDEKNKVKELNQQNEDLKNQVLGLVKNKASLISDLEEKDSNKLSNIKAVSELKDKIMEKDNKNKALSKAYKAMDDKNKYNDEEIKRLEKIIEETEANTDNMKVEHFEKVMELEKKLLEALEKNESHFENRFSNIRNSLSEISNMNPSPHFANNDDDKKKLSLDYEDKISMIKIQFNEEIKTLQTDLAKEREKYNLIIKEREKEIRKLQEEKKYIKDSVTKNYEKSLQKSDLTLKLKESEIEKIYTQLKKYEKIIELHNIKKK